MNIDSDVHHNGCEDSEYFYCKDCKELVHESQKNQCPNCMIFIPRVKNCICDMIEKPEPDYDWMRKYSIENPI